jgi:hypothetical protein
VDAQLFGGSHSLTVAIDGTGMAYFQDGRLSIGHNAWVATTATIRAQPNDKPGDHCFQADAVAGQTGDLFRGNDSSGNPIYRVKVDGSIVASGVSTIPGRARETTTLGTSGAVAIDLSVGDAFAISLSADATLSISNAPSASPWRTFALTVKTNGHALTWFGGIVWMTADGNPPTLASAAGKRTKLLFEQESSGVYLGYLVATQA